MSSLIVNRSELAEAVNFVKAVVPLRPILPANGNISIVYKEGSLHVSATDGLQGAKSLVNCTGDSEDFLAGCDPKRLVTVLEKDTSENLKIEYTGTELKFSDAEKGTAKFSKLSLANMKKAFQVISWGIKNPTSTVELDSQFIAEALKFLDDYLPEGKDEGQKHSVVVLSRGIAHSTNGVNLRGMVASGHLAFTNDISLRKKFVTNVAKCLQYIGTETVTFSDDISTVCFTSSDKRKVIVVPKTRQKPPAIPLTYLKSLGESIQFDFKEVLKGLAKINSSNYNTATTLTGVDLILKGSGENAKLNLILEGEKASHEFAVIREKDEDVQKLLDIKTLTKILKVYSKFTDTQVHLGDVDTKYIRFMEKRKVGEVVAAYITVCAYARRSHE